MYQVYKISLILVIVLSSVSCAHSPATVSWSGVPHGSPHPVRVWSEPLYIQPGCGISHEEDGCGEDYLIRYRYGGGAWHMHVPGVKVKASEIQFMILKNGVTNLPYHLSCDR